MLGLDETLQRDLYSSGKYLENTNNWSDGEAVHKARGLAAIIIDNSLTHIRSVLDVGCGSGGVLDELTKALPQIVNAVGIDTAPDAIRIGKQLRPSSRVDLRCEPLESVHERFDLAIASHVIEHANNYCDFLDELSARADLLYINIPCEANVLYSLRPSSHVDTFHKYGHLNFFSEPFFDALLHSRGFKILARGYGDEFKVQERRGLLGYGVYLVRRVLGVASPSLAMRLLGGWSYQVLVSRATVGE